MVDGKHPDRAAIQTGQLELLRALVAKLFPSNKFYTQKLQAAGLASDVASLADFLPGFRSPRKPSWSPTSPPTLHSGPT